MSFMLSPITGRFLVTPTGFAVHRRCCNQILINGGLSRLPPSITPVCWTRPPPFPNDYWLSIGHYGDKVWSNVIEAGGGAWIIDVDDGTLLANYSGNIFVGLHCSCPSDDSHDYCFVAGQAGSHLSDLRKLEYSGGSISEKWNWGSGAVWLNGVTCRPAGDKILVTGYRARAWSLPNSDWATVWEIDDATSDMTWAYDMSDRGTDCMHYSDYYYVASEGGGTPDNVTLWQFSLTGSVNWSKKFGNSVDSLWADSDGVRVFTRRTNDWPGAAGEYASVWKLDHGGNVIWSYDASDTGDHQGGVGICTANGQTRASYYFSEKSFVVLDDTDGTLIDSDNSISNNYGGQQLVPVGHRR